MAYEVTVTTRIPKDIERLLPEAGIKGRRAEWIRDAIMEKLKKEGKDDSLLRTGTQST